MLRLRSLAAATFGLAVAGSTSLSAVRADESLSVVASIKPVHSLVAAVMSGVSHQPHLLVDGANSPHTYALKPSDARALSDAAVVFWIGPDLEAFLDSTVDGLPDSTRVVALGTAPGVTRLAMREGGAWEEHMHEDGEEHHHDHEEHQEEHHDGEHHEDDHAGEHHEGDHDHEAHHEEHQDEAHQEEHHDEEAHGHHHHGTDAHVWLDPVNARAMVGSIVSALSEADPDNAEAYATHGAALEERLDHLTDALSAELGPVSDRPFVVFHDAYQYLEARFGLHAVGSITLSPEVAPGAARLAEIRAKVEETGAACIFREPQFSPRLAQVAMEGLDARIGVLDPLGADLEPGPALYEAMMRRNAEAIVGCLRQEG